MKALKMTILTQPYVFSTGTNKQKKVNHNKFFKYRSAITYTTQHKKSTL